jgi:hypothetical protein
MGAGEGIGGGLKDFLSGGANAAFGTNFDISGPSGGGGGFGGGGSWNVS